MQHRASFDDEVTSVTNTDTTRPRIEDRDDRVVEQTAFLPEDERPAPRRLSAATDDLNEPARRDQQDRVEIMARGSRDAIFRARERHRLRRSHPGDPLPGAYDDEAPITEAPTRRMAFAPDDYVEDEAPANSAPTADEPDDVLLRESSAPVSARGRRLRRSHEHTPAAATDAVPAAEMSPDTGRLTSRHGDDSRFDTVPEIRADVELPRLRRHVQERTTAIAESTDDASPDDVGAVNPYDEVIKRAQAIKAAAKADREARHQQTRRPIMPPLLDATSDRAPELPRIEDTPVEDVTAQAEPALADEPATAKAAAPPQVDTDWLASRGIRFQRHRQPEEALDEEAWDDEPAGGYAYEEEILPESAARNSWWRGIFRGRSQQDDTAVAPVYAATHDDDLFEDAYDEPYVPYDDPYAGPHEDDRVDPEMDWADDAEPVYIDAVAEVDTGPVVTTSMEAFEEDRHSFVERPRVSAPWHATEAISEVQSPPQPAYEPLDLANDAGLSAFRSRLFDAAPAEPAAEPVMAARAPIAVPRRTREERPTRAVQAAIDPEALLDDPRDAMYEPDVDPNFDVRALVAQQGDPLDMTIEVAPEIPRQCATCRSYRASEQGERGWCTNSWAFTHRQMVNAGDLACQSTIGCWWLPADEEVWLEDDAAKLDRATPRVDRMVAWLDPVRRTAGR
ncbi:MAG TPA: hypothetical protein VM450_20360 [Thermomicrobiales bacterium]|nr:hypothetical protein [Thermomicrobiales bacterium]